MSAIDLEKAEFTNEIMRFMKIYLKNSMHLYVRIYSYTNMCVQIA